MLAESSFKIMHRGEWPGPLTFRRGWTRADARPWNDAGDNASLRLVRGGSRFLEACTTKLLELGAPAVLSPPLPANANSMWLEAGYRPFLDLALMRRELDGVGSSPSHLVVDGDTTPLRKLLNIDAVAFTSFWRFDKYGFIEALEATSESDTLMIRDSQGDPAAFAIIGYGSAVAYLQRVAVSPQWQGQGMGRSLLRVAMKRARHKGAKIMLLNTQYNNENAIRLYQSEDFRLLPDPLTLLSFTSCGRNLSHHL